MDEVGNIIHDCEFIGGQYGIITKKPSPSWPFPLLDSSFENQTLAAIFTEEAGLSIVRCRFSHTPYAVKVRDGRSEELVMDQCRFENITTALTHISEPANARTQVNLLDCVATNSPVIASFEDGRANIAAPSGEWVRIQHFSHGLHLTSNDALPQIDTRLEASALVSVPATAVNPERLLPDNAQWVNVASLGAVGDGEFDNTAILRQAIKDHECLYFPTGRYRITDTLQLGADTCLIGLNPITTQILIQDESPAFHPAGPPKAVVESARAGRNILQGIGIDAGAINHRAVALKWMGSEASVVNDVRFIGGHGTYDSEGNYLQIYNNNRSADSDLFRRWDSMPASLWVTENGGGTFKNLWTPSTFAHAGMLVENTSTPGYAYQISSEHHVRNECILRNVKHWKFYAIQFEEESWEGRKTLPLQIHHCSDLSFHNTYVYRVMRTFTPAAYGIEISDSQRVQFHGIHAYGPSKFTVDDTLYILDSGTGIRSRELAWLAIDHTADFQLRSDPDPTYQLLASGFNHIDSPELDSTGKLYFVDEGNQHIWVWDPATQRTRLVLDIPLEPSQIVLENDTSLIILTRSGKVYRKDLSSGSGYAGISLLEPSEGFPAETRHFVVPTTRWRDSHDFLQVATEKKPQYFNLGNSLTIPAESTYPEARIFSSWFSTLDLQRTYDVKTYSPGEQVFVSDEFSQKTWHFRMQPDGTLTTPHLFAEEGEAGVVQDPATGKVFVAAGHIFVYNSEGDLLDTLTPPHRPTAIQLATQADGSRLLYILARSHLYSLKLSGPDPKSS